MQSEHYALQYADGSFSLLIIFVSSNPQKYYAFEHQSSKHKTSANNIPLIYYHQYFTVFLVSFRAS